MKRSLLMTLAALVAATTFAQPSAVPSLKLQGTRLERVGKKPLERMRSNRRTAQPSAMLKAPSRAPQVISATPAGEKKTYSRQGYYNYVSNQQVQSGDQSGFISFVFADNNVVYVQNPLAGAITDTWVKGTLSADGKTITVPVGQYIYYSAAYGYGLVVYVANSEIVEDEDGSYEELVIDESVQNITYTIKDENTIILDGLTEEQALAGFWDDDLSWAGYADQFSVYTLYVEDLTLATPPAGLVTKEQPLQALYYTADADEGQAYTRTVKVGADGNDYYVQGLVSQFPDAWLKGTFDDEHKTVSFPVQFVGQTAKGDKYFFAGTDGYDLTPYELSVYDNYAIGDPFAVLNTNGAVIDWDGMYGYYSGLFFGTEPAVVTLPEGAEVHSYPMSGYALGNSGYENYDGVANVGVVVTDAGAELYFQGIFGSVPGAWMKGTLDSETGSIIVPCGQYLGREDGSSVALFAMGLNMVQDEEGETSLDDTPSDIVILYDPSRDVFVTSTVVIASRKPDEMALYDFYAPGLLLGSLADASWAASTAGYTEDTNVAEFVIDEANNTKGVNAKGSNMRNQPKYYVEDGHLRLFYGNTMTISSDKEIAEIIFTFDDPLVSEQTGAASYFNHLAVKNGVGELEIGEDGTSATWTGLAKEVAFEVPNTAGLQARIRRIDVNYFDPSTTLVTAPEGLQTENYVYTAIVATDEGLMEFDQDILVGFDGNDVYFQGICDWLPEAWIKGELKDGVVTIPGWYLGIYELQYSGGTFELPLTFGGATLAYDAAENLFTCDEITILSEGEMVDQVTEVRISKGSTGVTAPALKGTASTQTFDLSGRMVNAGAKGLLIQQVRQADGSVKTVKVLRK